MEHGLSKNEIISVLTKSPHGDLKEYLPTGTAAAAREPEFFAHLIAWNHIKGQIRDAKVALPMSSLAVQSFPDELAENSFAHVASLDPRNMVRALRFGKEIKTPGRGKSLVRMVRRYLASLEENRGAFSRVGLQHRKSIHELYALTHTKPSEFADAAIFKGIYQPGSVFEAISQLKNMSPEEAAGTILERRLPYLSVMGALGGNLKDPSVVLALIQRMSPTELTTNVKMLEKLGVKTIPALRAAFEEGLGRASKGKANVFKTTRAAEAVDDPELKAKLQGLQERQLKAQAGIEGNWLVLGDKSMSMSRCIDTARIVAGTLAKMVRGKVHLVFFDENPSYFDVTDMEYEKILDRTKFVRADGATSVGCGLEYCMVKGIEVDGIAIISDGGENRHPAFVNAYAAYARQFEKRPPVYYYYVQSKERDTLKESIDMIGGLTVDRFDLTGVDFYSLPNIVQTMRANRYSLVDEIMETPLLSLDEVFKVKEKGVLVNA